METGHIRALVLYDGVCGLCNRFVQLILKADSHGAFLFAPQQSEYAQALLRNDQIKDAELESIILVPINREGTKLRSDAVFRILRDVGGAWSLLSIFSLLPRVLTDAVYTFVASNRYQWFGKYDQCPIPSATDRARILTDDDPRWSLFK